jgi:Xaa-Pro aminopeptidase
MSDTPRTDAATFHRGGLLVVQQDLARTLERELAAAKAIADRCGKDNCMGWDVEGCSRWVSEVRLNKARIELAAAKADVEALRAALTLYMNAGAGNSTDYELQRAAYYEARAALAKEKS